MTAIYEEIYEYQFELMDAMAAYVRSSVALDAAKDINTEFEEVTNLNINSGSTLNNITNGRWVELHDIQNFTY